MSLSAWLVTLAFGAASCHAQDSINKKALAYFANAADYQNAGAFELAAQEWEKLVAEFPKESQTSTAWHHLGICNLQQKEPNHQRAIEAFRQSLKDNKLELRSESLINLGWALLTESRKASTQAAHKTELLKEARQCFGEYLKSFPEDAYSDQAIFYLGDIEHLTGNHRKAIAYFKQMLDDDRFSRSNLRPDALYALAVAYEDQKNSAEAGRWYQEFLTQYESHHLANEVAIRRAELLLKDNKAQEAIGLLKRVSQTDQGAMRDLALLRLGQIQLQQDNPSAASDSLQRLVEQFPESEHRWNALLALGQIAAKDGHHDQAQKYFREALNEKSPVAAEATHGLALSLMRQDKHVDAANLVESAIKQFQDSTHLNTLRLDYADALYASPGRTGEARKLYEAIASDSPTAVVAPRAAYNAAFAALEAGQPDAAQVWAERFLNQYPGDALRSDVAYVAAEALLRKGQHAPAAAAYEKLIAADGQNSNVSLWKLRQSMARYLDGQYLPAAQAASVLADSLSVSDQKAEALFIAGASYLLLEKFDQAIESLKASHSASDQWTSADECLLMLAEAYQRTQNSADARLAYQQLLKKYPQSRLRAQAQYKLAQLVASEGDYVAAVQQYRSIVADPAANSFHHFASYGIAWSLMQQDQHEQALQELQPLLAKNLQDSIGSDALLAEGICLRKLQQPQQALASLQKFISRGVQGTSLGNGLYELGMVHTELKQMDQANQAFERLIAEAPDYPGMDKALYEIGWNLHEQGKSEQSKQRFEELTQKFPNSQHSADANYMIAQQLYDAGKYDQAAAGYQRIAGQTKDEQLLEKSYYKLGWSQHQMNRFDEAAATFEAQIIRFPKGRLAVDAMFMQAECAFKQDLFEVALTGFQQARKGIESTTDISAASPQVRTLIYLHGAQCLRELKRWSDCQQWLEQIVQHHADSPYLPTALYELGFCKQSQGKTEEAIVHYTEVANNYRNEVAARARFMLGEIYFGQRDLVKAIPEFQRVMYGFGGEKAPDEIKNWQAKSAIEAARCSEALIQTLSGPARKKVVDTTIGFYEFVVEKHPKHELASQAQSRLGELQKLR
jgi:TolA-binding protein